MALTESQHSLDHLEVPVRYGSVCSGIEAATVAWHPLGWQASFFSEIDTFPRAVLAHHYPAVPCHGDFTTIEADTYDSIEVLVGGTPCQDFSVAGKRAGLDGERGNLTLEYALLARRLGAKWLVWENVPGVFSNNGGRDFGAVIACFAGYPDGTIFQPPVDGWRNSGIVPPAGPYGHGLAWRVLDAQFAGVPQRRRRVFVVGYLGDWRPAAAVLLERQSLQGNPPPCREAREGVASTLAGGARQRGGSSEDDIPKVSLCLNAGGMGRSDSESETLLPVAFSIMPQNSGRDYKAREVDVLQPLMAGGQCHGNQGGDVIVQPLPFDCTQVTSKANRSNPQPGDPCHPLAAGAHAPTIAFDCKASGRNGFGVGEVSPTLRAMGHKGSHTNAGGQVAVAFGLRADAARSGEAKTPSADAEGRMRKRDAGFNVYDETAPTLDASHPHSVGTATAVRRLLPVECERLQGVPDHYTAVPVWTVRHRKACWLYGTVDVVAPAEGRAPCGCKIRHVRAENCPDGPRYKSLGNSMAVPVMRWIGERVAAVEAILCRRAAA